MKAKTIKKVIGLKINNWLDSIDDEEVRTLAATNTIVTGGCIASMLLQESVNDFDIYFRNKETAVSVAMYYVKKFKDNLPVSFENGRTVEIFVKSNTPDDDDRVKIIVKSAGVAGENSSKESYGYFEQNAAIGQQEFIDVSMPEDGDEAAQAVEAAEENGGNKYRPVYLSSNAVTLSDKIQIIIRFFGDPDEIHKNYDFAHCTNYWTSWENKLVLRPAALEAIITRELVYIGSKYPLCSIIRTRKFIKRNWCINAGQFVKMAMQLNELNLLDINVLEDQLTGVDVAYFVQIIDKLKGKEDITTAYIIEIIDRMF